MNNKQLSNRLAIYIAASPIETQKYISILEDYLKEFYSGTNAVKIIGKYIDCYNETLANTNLIKLLKDAEAGKFDKILIYSFEHINSRLSVVLSKFLIPMQKLGITVECYEAGFDSSKESDKFRLACEVAMGVHEYLDSTDPIPMSFYNDLNPECSWSEEQEAEKSYFKILTRDIVKSAEKYC